MSPHHSGFALSPHIVNIPYSAHLVKRENKLFYTLHILSIV
jgi:hypothetical protein